MKQQVIIIGLMIMLSLSGYPSNGIDKAMRHEMNRGTEGKKLVSDVTLGECKVLLDSEYILQLIMYKGRFYKDTELGPFYGDNWLGDCKLVLSRNGEKVFEYFLDDDWDEEMRFQNEFVIETYDYDKDGQLEFLIGQYLSSNINEYRLYRITEDKRIVKVEGGETIHMSGKNRYSCILDVDSNGEVGYQFYDNSKGQEVKKIIKFERDIDRR